MGVSEDILYIQTASSEEIIVAMENNFFAYLSCVSKRNDGVNIWDVENLTLISAGLVGHAVLPHNIQKVKYIIELVKVYFGGLARSAFSWWVGPNSEPSDLAILLQECGLNLKRSDVGMALDLKNFKVPPNKREDFTVSIVDSVSSLQEYVQVFVQYWDPPNMGMQSAYLKAQKTILHPESPIKLFIGRLGGEPISSCELYLQNGVAGIYAVTTAKKMRKQGFASRLLSAPLEHAAQCGYEIATLLATPVGIHLYNDLGFKDLCQFHEYTFNK